LFIISLEMNPVEGVWSSLKRSLANRTRKGHRPPGRAGETRLRRTLYRPGLIDGFLANTGLDLTPFGNPRH
jgi:putative transposase